ncbi:MAG: hypothetical protein OXL41_03940 [Nitrospinae bacterium]|nr:hypothetical protein [Nitrospinota bacterium]
MPKHKLASFPVEMINFWQQPAGLEIDCDDRGQAYNLRARLNECRLAMEAEAHPAATRARGMQLRLVNNETTILLAQRLSTQAELLRNAGVPGGAGTGVGTGSKDFASTADPKPEAESASESRFKSAIDYDGILSRMSTADDNSDGDETPAPDDLQTG